MKRTERALSLIEITIIVVIVGIVILVGVLVPRLRGTRDDEAMTQLARSELRTIATAIESYYLQNGHQLPTTLSMVTSATPRLLTTIPDDPFRSTSNSYTLYKDTTGVYYVVFSYGPDHAPGITGISTSGALTGTIRDDICVTNGTSAGHTRTC